ncbi:potassium-transporting ATPase subunit KdpA [Dermatobacter hominis]|uniref:potassium-transporting ATPase subunit KdpA n=1 Tax=Dermatobacter hominis TaxID=2884263 RepID=UPI001D12AD06|nr:potassium-transporting ATPase subunit KdpA [Dermatobacter hominis]UDY34559.1 potassium-transporting ATPase subunit KdpA [Dermatobacter hominis]
MSAQGIFQLVLLVVVLALTAPPLGRYMARVYAHDPEGGPAPAPGDRVFLPVERLIYRLLRVDPEREQRWNVYAVSLLAFSFFSVLLTYVILRVQGALPVNPTDMPGMAAHGAWNAAVSFTTNTNWQWFSGEQAISHLTQMVGFTVQNFVSAAAGMAVAVAIVRGIARRQGRTLGNFWVDLVRGTLRILLPISFVAAVLIVGLGVTQNLHGDTTATTVDRTVTATVVDADGKEHTDRVDTQEIPGGPVASQVAIRNLGTNGGGFYNANAAHPFENPNGWTNLVGVWMLLLIPFAFPFAFGRMVGQPRQGLVLLGVMALLLTVSIVLMSAVETGGNPAVSDLGVSQASSAQTVGGNLEGKEVRYGAATCSLYGAASTGTSTGSVNCMHDSLTPAGGAVPMVLMQLGEVSPGGVGSGLIGILINALLAVFIAGLMVGRTPEYLGKKIQAAEMKLVVLYIVAMPVAVLVFAAVSVVLPTAVSSLANPGPHGLSEALYNFASAGNNNGSAFAGMSTGTDWYTITQGVAMLIGRFLLVIPALAIGGSLVRKNKVPVTVGTFPTDSPLFFGLLTGVIIIVAGLTFFPALALGPIVEQLSL